MNEHIFLYWDDLGDSHEHVDKQIDMTQQQLKQMKESHKEIILDYFLTEEEDHPQSKDDKDESKS